jgi:hypothetical protein
LKEFNPEIIAEFRKLARWEVAEFWISNGGGRRTSSDNVSPIQFECHGTALPESLRSKGYIITSDRLAWVLHLPEGEH